MVTRVRAPNPSPMTLDGTNGYVIPVGPGALVAIDPGVSDEKHIAVFLDIAHRAHARYAAILVTHGHPDHYPGALALRRATQAPIFAHTNATFGQDRSIGDGTRIPFEDATFTALYTPGHAHDHLVFWLQEQRALFTGDVVIGTGTVVVAPPSGDMRAYQASLERLLRDYGHADVIYGGHGPTVKMPRAKLEEYIAHRKAREAQIIAALTGAPATIPELVASIYASVGPALWPAAARQVLAYLIALEREGRVVATTLEREPTTDETALLQPNLATLASDAEREVARAELGVESAAEPLLSYALTG